VCVYIYIYIYIIGVSRPLFQAAVWAALNSCYALLHSAALSWATINRWLDCYKSGRTFEQAFSIVRFRRLSVCVVGRCKPCSLLDKYNPLSAESRFIISREISPVGILRTRRLQIEAFMWRDVMPADYVFSYRPIYWRKVGQLGITWLLWIISIRWYKS